MQLLDRLNLGIRRKTPLILQTETSECGLACIGMVLGHFGTATDLAALRGRHGVMSQGMTVIDLVRVASEEHLSTRALRLTVHEIRQLKLPCILHWEMSHFVVLREIRDNKAIILDPAFGEREVGEEEFSQRFTGIAIEAWPDSDFAPRQEAQSISVRRLLGRVHGLWTTLWRVLAVSLALEVLGLLSPLFMQWVVDQVLVSRDLQLLTTLGIGFALVLLTQQFFTVIRSWLVLRIGTQLKVQWRTNVLSHLVRLPLDYFARRHLGDVMSRYHSIGSIQSVLTTTFLEVVLDGLMVALTFGLMLLYSPMLTILALCSVALYVVVRLVWYGPLRAATQERIVRSAVESTHLLETVRGVRTIRLFSRHAERLSSWQSLLVADINAQLRIDKLNIFYRVVRGTLSGAFALLLLWMGAREVVAGQLSVGMLLAFLAYRGQFDSRFTDLVNKFFDLKMMGLDAQRLADIVLTPRETETSGAAQALPMQAPRIEFRDVYFRYAASSPDVLCGLNLVLEPARATAIAGPSGCGKTTLVSLLLGIYKPQSGQILVDGVPLERIGLDAWRSRIGTVMQDDSLFSGSIAENISFFDPQIDRQRVERCARLAAVHDDISAMPMGYETLVGDMGSSLSGGQRQRVLLARALYRLPTMLILDEATSHLDLQREAQVGRAIAAMRLTRLVVAHRPQTLALVDRVVELSEGRVLRDESAQAYRERHQDNTQLM
ncbi:MAG: peptidase domain-containing ABC transporter [Rubrivivax sp.]|jgi:ATP-binding cassette subfamily B protein RaxB|nr:peptidase domain-containing ABC transporter [Rubrivivax sp.]